MPRLDWTIIAQSHAVDRTSNALSIFNILETISLDPETPDPSAGTGIGLPLAFSVIQGWSREADSPPEKTEARVKIVGPSGTALAVVEIAVDLSASTRARTMVNANAFPYAGVGDYRFESELRIGDEWKPISVATVTVAKGTPTLSVQPV
jgi:hypothetical protein